MFGTWTSGMFITCAIGCSVGLAFGSLSCVSARWYSAIRRGSWGASPEECTSILECFADAGGNFIDTASNYAGGDSERIVGELIASDRDRWVIGTKYTVSARPEDPNAGGNHRKNLVRSLRGSLARLGTDYLDVLWVHAPDRFTPIEEVLGALDDQVRTGTVLYTGISDFPAWRVAYAVGGADAPRPDSVLGAAGAV